VFELVAAQYVSDGKRKDFRHELHPVKKTVLRVATKNVECRTQKFPGPQLSALRFLPPLLPRLKLPPQADLSRRLAPP